MFSSKSSVMYIWDIEISICDISLITLNIIFFAVVTVLWIYYSIIEEKNKIKSIPIGQFCNIGEGATSKFFSTKGIGKEPISRRRQGGKSSAQAAKEGKHATINEVEIKCNFCKDSFWISSKSK